MGKDKQEPKVIKGKSGNIKRVYSLSNDEKYDIQNLQSVMGILRILVRGMELSMMEKMAEVRDRLGIKNDPPEGFERVVDIDKEKFEILVYDIKKVKKDEQPGKEPVKAD